MKVRFEVEWTVDDPDDIKFVNKEFISMWLFGFQNGMHKIGRRKLVSEIKTIAEHSKQCHENFNMAFKNIMKNFKSDLEINEAMKVVKYKGYEIIQGYNDGRDKAVFTITKPPYDKGSEYDTLEAAKAAIDKWIKNRK